ncbi:MAG: hypothetical protein IT405_00625 [Candidatus Yanofskybacteria bacterium]|nr:hypothetical protein [Candidatus Yanofskybacteria bacterium]
MTSQPPLLDPIGPALPGPLFTPRPGWGGKLRIWFSEHAYLLVFRLVVVCALVLIVRSFWVARTPQEAERSPVPRAPVESVFVLTAQSGDGITTLAAHAIDLRLAAGPAALRLDGAQHLFAVDSLARLAGWAPLSVGQEVRFESSDITTTILHALTLPPHQHAAWERVLRTR